MTVAATGTPSSAPDSPKSWAPSRAAPKETAGWRSTARAEMRGSMVRFSTCW